MSYKGFIGRISKEEKEFYDLKNKAVEYYRANGVPQKLEAVLNEMFFEKPNDLYGYLADYFTGFSITPVICAIAGKEVFVSRGDEGLQVDMYCIIRNQQKLICSAVVTGGSEEVLDSGDAVACVGHQQESVAMALKWIKKHLSCMLHNLNPAHQTHVDKLLSEFYMAHYLKDQDARKKKEKIENDNKIETAPEIPPPSPLTPSKDKKKGAKGKKGSTGDKPLPPPEPAQPVLPWAMAVSALSLVTAKTASRLTAVPLYQHIINLRDPQALRAVSMPIPLVTVLSCGKASPGKLNLLEEVILFPTAPKTIKQVIETCRDLQREMKRLFTATAKLVTPMGVSEEGALQLSFDRPDQALNLLLEACTNLSIPIGKKLQLVINCSAQTLMDFPKGKYEVMEGALKTPDELLDILVGLMNNYPTIAAFIDPFRKEINIEDIRTMKEHVWNYVENKTVFFKVDLVDSFAQDVEQWQKLSSLTSQSCNLIADAAYCLCPCWKEAKPLPPGVTWVTLRPCSEMTLTDLLDTITKQPEKKMMFAANSEEAGDDSMVDVAVGLGAAFIKLGGLNGGERMKKYNRLLSIERELKEQGKYGDLVSLIPYPLNS